MQPLSIRIALLTAVLLHGTLTLPAQHPLPAPPLLTLKSAIEMAEARSYPARTAESTRESARERHHAFTAGYLPGLSLSGTTPNYSRSITPVVQPDGTTLYVPLQQTYAGLTATVAQKVPWTNTTLLVSSGLNQFKVAGPTGFETWSSAPLTIGISQPLLHSNSMRWDIREQEIQLEGSERRYLEARETVAVDVTNTFFDLYAAGLNLKNASANLTINDTLYTLNKGRLEIGKIGENDLLQSELAVLRSRQSLEDSRLAYDRAQSQSRLSLNLAPGTSVELAVPDDIPQFDADTAAAVHWARLNSSTIEDAVATEVHADRSVSEARWDGGVGGTVNASYGFNATGNTAGNAYANLLNSQSFALSVSVPLWQWGVHSAGLEAAHADRDAARNTAALSRAQVDLDAHYAALQLTQARRSLVIATKADTVAAKRFDVAYNRYVIGKITIDNLYIAQSEKDQALQAFVQALRAYWTAYYQLRRTTLYDFEVGQQIRG